MKMYAISDFEKFEKIGKFIICPSGDYTQIKEFPIYCIFGKCSIFGKCCSFSKRCSFGEYCNFGECCSFDNHCSFSEYCSFGECCSFGEYCSFGKRCSFGKLCIFSSHCSFGVRCKCENGKEFMRLVSFEGTGSAKRKTYCFLLADGKAYRMFFESAKFELTDTNI